MARERLSVADLRILSAVLSGALPAGRLAKAIGRSPSYTSECIRRLRKMELVETSRNGISVIVRPSANSVMDALAILLKEGSGLAMTKILTGPGLTLLPHLLSPGSTSRELIRKTTLSRATVMNRLRLWRGMGIISRDGSTGLYHLAHGHRTLADFTARYSARRIRRTLDESVPGAIILWQDREEFLLSVEAGTPVKGLVVAGPSALEKLGYGIVHSRDYYSGGRSGRKVSEEEALVQTFLTDRGNPRARRWILDGLRGLRISAARLSAHARKYGVGDEMNELLEGFDGTKEVHP